MRRGLLMLATAMTAVAVAGLLVVAGSGVVSVSAHRGHWPIAEWFLRFGMQRSVRAHARDIEVPALDDPRLVLRGARYYAIGCASCHGAPGQAGALLAQRLVPPAPAVGPDFAQWRPNELFWIVREGLKYTAMPPWAAHERDDEVWAVVAFLLELPNMNRADYTKLALGLAPAEGRGDAIQSRNLFDGAAAQGLGACIACHGHDGLGLDGAFPRLAGQSEIYLIASVQAYADGSRRSGMMQPVAAGLDPEALRAAAAYYAALRVTNPASAKPAGQATRRRGEQLAMHGDPAHGVPACNTCHDAGPPARNPHFPLLGGQYPEFLALQLKLFQQGRRGGTAYEQIMQEIAVRLSAEQVEDVARYYGSLPGPPAE